MWLLVGVGGEVRWAMGGSRSLLFCFGDATNHAGLGALTATRALSLYRMQYSA